MSQVVTRAQRPLYGVTQERGTARGRCYQRRYKMPLWTQDEAGRNENMSSDSRRRLRSTAREKTRLPEEPSALHSQPMLLRLTHGLCFISVAANDRKQRLAEGSQVIRHVVQSPRFLHLFASLGYRDREVENCGSVRGKSRDGRIRITQKSQKSDGVLELPVSLMMIDQSGIVIRSTFSTPRIRPTSRLTSIPLFDNGAAFMLTYLNGFL